MSLGSSDAPTIMGASSFESPFGLWAVKTGKLEEKREVTRRMRAGHALEAEIARELEAEREGLELFDPGDFTIIFDSETPWRHATVDRLYAPKGTFKGVSKAEPIKALERARESGGVAEFKTVSGFMQREWAEEPTLYALVQVQHQLLVTGLERAIVAAWMGLGEDFQTYDVQRHEGAIEAIDKAEREFQEAVESKTPPEPDAHQRTSEALAALYPKEELEEIELPEEAVIWYEELQTEKLRRRHSEDRIRLAQNQLKAMIQDHQAGVIPGVARISWSTVRRPGYEVKATSYRQLRIKEEKE